jgi:Tol biopolymer transport system component
MTRNPAQPRRTFQLLAFVGVLFACVMLFAFVASRGQFGSGVIQKVATVLTPPARFSETYLCPYRKDGNGGFSPWWVAYIVEPATGATDKSTFVDINGKRLGPYSNVSGLMRVSRDGKHLAFAAQKGNNWVVVVDGMEKYTHKGLVWPWSAWSPTLEGNSFIPQTRAAVLQFSPDGRSIAYPAETENSKYAVFVNGEPGQEFPDIGDNISFVAGSVKYYAFNSDKKLLEVHGNQVLGPFDNSYATKLSPDGRHYAFQATQGTRNLLVVDDKVMEIPGEVGDYVIGDSGVYAYSYKSGGKYSVRVISVDIPGNFDEVTELTLSSDGKSVAFWERRDATWSLWAMGKELPGFGGYFYYVSGNKYSVMWSPDSQHVAYYVRDGEGLVLDGQKLDKGYRPPGIALQVIVDDAGRTVGTGMMSGPQVDSQAFVQAVLQRDKTKCDPFSVSLVGQALTCIEKSGDIAYMHVGDKAEGPYRDVRSVVFASSNAKHYAYVVETEKGQQMVVDGALRPHIYDAIYRPNMDDTNGSVIYLAVKAGNLVRVVQPFGAD